MEGRSLDEANTILEEAMPIVQLAIQRRKQVTRGSRYAVGGGGDEQSRKVSDNGRKLSGDMRQASGGVREFWGEGTISTGHGRKISGSEEARFAHRFARSDSWRSDSTTSSSPKKSSITNSPVLKIIEVTQDGSQSMRMRRASSHEGKVGQVSFEHQIRGQSLLDSNLRLF